MWDDLARWIARRLPKRVVYWAFILKGARHIKGDEVVPEVPFVEVLRRLER